MKIKPSAPSCGKTRRYGPGTAVYIPIYVYPLHLFAYFYFISVAFLNDSKKYVIGAHSGTSSSKQPDINFFANFFRPKYQFQSM
jgi:hypothetical protein